MILDEAAVLFEAKAERPERMAEYDRQSETYEVHYFGERTETAAHLSRMDGFENDRQYELRKKLAIGNAHLVSDLLTPVSSIWSAKGGSTNYNGLNDTERTNLLEKIRIVGAGMDMRTWMREFWMERFVVDPNGIQFIEVDAVDKRAYLTYKSVKSIKNYKLNGLRLDYVVFQPFVNIPADECQDAKKNDYVLLWVVDDAKYYKVKVYTQEGKKIAEIVDTQVNSFGVVPGVINSSLINTRGGGRDSLLRAQLDLLDSYLSKNSRKEIHQNLHDYPIPWEYETLCPVCAGKRLIEGRVCNACGGTGVNVKKDVSTVRLLRNVTDGEEGRAPNPPAGYVQPDIQTMQAQRDELDWLFNTRMFFSMWGATRERAENETATGRFIDTQPVNNRLTRIAELAQDVESEILTFFAKHYYNKEDVKVRRVYGKRFMLETPDQLWKKYETAKQSKVTPTVLSLMLLQYYEGEFQNDAESFEYYAKLLKVEPWPHLTIDEVLRINGVDPLDLQCKIYYQEWLASDSGSREQIMGSDVKTLQESLKAFAVSKKVNN